MSDLDQQDKKPLSPGTRPIRLLAPEFVPLDEEHERQAIAALAELLAPFLPAEHADAESLDSPGLHRDVDAPWAPVARKPVGRQRHKNRDLHAHLDR